MRRLSAFVLAPLLLVAQEPVEVARSKTFTEGPVFDRQGNLYFSHREGIYKLSPGGELIEWIHDASAGFNGHKILPDGTHIVCASNKSAIWHLDANGKYLGDASRECDGKPLKEPNDITLDSYGGFYFTDPAGSRKDPVGCVYYVDRSGKTSRAAGGMMVPNGLVINRSATFLYVSETTPNRVLRFRITAPGKFGPMEVFAKLPSREGHEAVPDGMAMDTDDNLYVAHLGTSHVLVLNPEGKLVRTLPGGNYDVSNLAFGGKNLDQLFITGSVGYRKNTEGRVFRLALKGVKGRQ
jgi:gluconolactonase